MLLSDLHRRQGWQALGYLTLKDCITAEFGMSEQRAHQLLNANAVDEILAEGGSTVVEFSPIPERHARDLVRLWARDPARGRGRSPGAA